MSALPDDDMDQEAMEYTYSSDSPLDIRTQANPKLGGKKRIVTSGPARNTDDTVLDDREDPDYPGLSGELLLLTKFPFRYVRKGVLENVNDVLWLDNLQAIYEELERRKQTKNPISERCLMCTLPHGTCKHTKKWVEEKEDKFIKSLIKKNDIDTEIDDILGVMGGSSIDATVPKEEEKSSADKSSVNLYNLRWYQLEQRMADKIGDTFFCVHQPVPRGWHTVTFLLDRFVIVYGGVRYKGSEIPQPFSGAPKGGDFEIIETMYVYDMIEMTWHVRGGKKPAYLGPDDRNMPVARYGHIACAIDDHRMLIFGGRGGPSGRCLDDTWVYDFHEDSWHQLCTSSAVSKVGPSPRIHSAAIRVDDAPDAMALTSNEPNVRKMKLTMTFEAPVASVLLFGGTDGVENFGDLWQMKLPKETNGLNMQWERVIAIGPVPSARYGHKLVTLGSIKGRVAVLGGCCVSPLSETEGGSSASLDPKDTKVLIAISKRLQQAYVSEGFSADLAGRLIDARLQNNDFQVESVLREAARATGRIFTLEKQTRELECELVHAYKVAQGARLLTNKRSKHADSHLDIHFLSLRELTWKPQIYPAVRGDIPSARIFFACMSSDTSPHIIVVGGANPTSRKFSCIDGHVYVLDLKTMLWSKPTPSTSAEFLKVPMEVARSDIVRAKLRVKDAIFTAISLGSRTQRTVEVLEAENVLRVCEWRLEQLEKELSMLLPAPKPRFGASLQCLGQRGLFFGGWGESGIVQDAMFSPTALRDLASVGGATNTKAESCVSMIVDYEDEMEKRRRESDEFTAKIHREKQEDEHLAALKDIQFQFELQMVLRVEKQNEYRERQAMTIEDMISAVPPLSKPNVIVVRAHNNHTAWLRFDQIEKDANNVKIDPSTVQYTIFMRSTYVNFLEEDRVILLCDPPPSENNDKDSDDDSDDNKSKDDKTKKRKDGGETGSLISDPSKRLKFPAEIIKVHGDGYFDVACDDGSTVKRAHRSRLLPILSLPSPQVATNAALRKQVKLPSDYDNLLQMKLDTHHQILNCIHQSRRIKRDAVEEEKAGTSAGQGDDDANDISTDGKVKPMVKLRPSVALERRLAKKEMLFNRMKKALLKYNPKQQSFPCLDATLGKTKQNLLRRSSSPTNTNSMSTSSLLTTGALTATGGLIHSFSSSALTTMTTTTTNALLGATSSRTSPPSSSQGARGSPPPTQSEIQMNTTSNINNNTISKGSISNLNTYSNPSSRPGTEGRARSRSQKRRPTVVAASEWSQVYMGPWCDDFYVTNLVPRGVLESEAGPIDPNTGIGGFEITVEFKVQVKGCDFPSYELSQFSDPVQVSIKATSTVPSSDASSRKSTASKSNSQGSKEDEDDDAASEMSDDDKQTYESSFMKSSITSKPFSHITAETEEEEKDKKLVSKVRELVYNVVLNETTIIQLHQIRDSTYSYGVGDEYI